MRKAVQQLMLGKVIKSEEQTVHVLEQIAFAGYDGIELNGYMIRKTPVFVRPPPSMGFARQEYWSGS